MNLIRKYKNVATIEGIPIPFLQKRLSEMSHDFSNGLIKYDDRTLLQCANHYFKIIPRKTKCMNIRKQMGFSITNNDCVQCLHDCIEAYKQKKIILR